MPESEQPKRGFIALITQAEDGRLLVNLDDEITSCLDHTFATGETSVLEMKLEVRLVKSLENGVVQFSLTPKLNSKLPKGKTMPTVFFSNADREVSRENWNQMRLFEEKENVRKMQKREAN